MICIGIYQICTGNLPTGEGGQNNFDHLPLTLHILYIYSNNCLFCSLPQSTIWRSMGLTSWGILFLSGKKILVHGHFCRGRFVQDVCPTDFYAPNVFVLEVCGRNLNGHLHTSQDNFVNRAIGDWS